MFSSIHPFENQVHTGTETGRQRRSRRRDRSLQYLRAQTAAKNRSADPQPSQPFQNVPLEPIFASPTANIIPPTETQLTVPRLNELNKHLDSKWARVREKSPQMVAQARIERNRGVMLDTNIRNDSNPKKLLDPDPGASNSFSDVVKSAMVLKNWLTAMEHNERESEPEREMATTTNFVEETVNEERAIIGNEIESFHTTPTGPSVLKEFLKGWIKRITFFYVIETSLFFYYWTCIVTVGILYNMLACVIFIFDDVYNGYFDKWMDLNLFFDVIFLIDILIQSRLVYLHEGMEVKNTVKLLRNYIDGSRKFGDFLCLIPLDLILFKVPTLSLCRVPRLIKSYRLMDFVEFTQKRTSFPHAMRILILMTACYILFHWNACIYYLFSLFDKMDANASEESTMAFGFSYLKVFEPLFPNCQAYFDDDCWYEEDEARVLDLDDERPNYALKMYEYWENKHYEYTMGNFSREYSMTMYWSSLTITKCGQQPWPTRSAQNLLEVVDTLIGVLVFATIIGSVGNVVTQMNQSVYDFREMMDGIKFYMKYRSVDAEIQDRVLNCFMYLNTHNQLYDEKEILEVLPPKFQSTIAAHLHIDTLKKVQLFQGCDPRFLNEVVLLVKQQVYSPNDYLCRKNEKAKEMFIVKKGTLSVIDDANDFNEMELLREGSTFGELSIVQVKGNLLGDRRSVSLRSVGYSDVYILNQDDVTRLLAEYPDARDVLLKNARDMLHERGLLETSELGERRADEDDFYDEGMIELLPVEEQLSRLNNIVHEMNEELTCMITSFSHSTLYFKQRVTSLENTFNFNRKRIRRDCIRGNI